MFTTLMMAALLGAGGITVDFAAPTGPVKPVNGVGQPPMVGAFKSWSMFHYLKEAGIPYSRLHDVGGWLGGGLYVDIPNVFPDFDADENNPENYRFVFTDSLISALVANDVEPFFRLGVSIENWVECQKGFPPQRIHPPKDYAKWARICEHIIRHYTEGWANGFHHKIEFWEIWNEPENFETKARNCMWHGDWKSYCDFYGVVAPYLKTKFPHLKIGGYGSCGFYAAVGSARVAAANSSPRMQFFVEAAKTFLARARDEKWPLDFFSYHSYSKPAECLQQCEYADRLLTEYGFTREKTLRINNEWLPSPRHEELGAILQASRIAAEMIAFQNGPVDLACIYDARCGVGNYSPLFNPLTYKPHRAYYVFVAFNELRKLGTAVACSAPETLSVCAATDGKGKGAVMIANISGSVQPLPGSFGGYAVKSVRVLDQTRNLEETSLPKDISDNSVLLITLEKSSGNLN